MLIVNLVWSFIVSTCRCCSLPIDNCSCRSFITFVRSLLDPAGYSSLFGGRWSIFVPLLTIVFGSDSASQIDPRVMDVLGKLVGYAGANITRIGCYSKQIRNSWNKLWTRAPPPPPHPPISCLGFVLKAQTCFGLTISIYVDIPLRQMCSRRDEIPCDSRLTSALPPLSHLRVEWVPSFSLWSSRTIVASSARCCWNTIW